MSPPLTWSVHYCAQAPSTLESDDSFATGKRDRVGTKAEKEFTKLFESWLNSTTSVLRAAIFGDDTVSFCFISSVSLGVPVFFARLMDRLKIFARDRCYDFSFEFTADSTECVQVHTNAGVPFRHSCDGSFRLWFMRFIRYSFLLGK